MRDCLNRESGLFECNVTASREIALQAVLSKVVNDTVNVEMQQAS